MHVSPEPGTSVFAGRPAPDLPGMLLDGIAETLVHTSDPQERSLVVLALVAEIHDAAGWLVDGPGSAEMASLGQVLRAAHAHHDRMSRPDHAAPAGHGGGRPTVSDGRAYPVRVDDEQAVVSSA